MASAAEQVGMIGLGAMGQGIALNLAKFVAEVSPSQPLLVWNRTPSKAEEVLSLGAKFAEGGVAELAKTCDITFCMSFDDASLLEIVEVYTQHARKGSIFVSMPTVHPATTTKASELCTSSATQFVACPVFGRPDAARGKTLVCAVAGPAQAKSTIAPYLAAIGRANLDLGEDPAAASVQKLVGNYMIVGVVELMAEAMTLGEKSGLSREQFLTFVKSFFPAPPVVGYATRMVNLDFDTQGGTQGFSVDGGIKDASLIAQLGDETSVNTLAAKAALQHLQQQRDAGGAGKDFASLVEVLRKEAGLQ